MIRLIAAGVALLGLAAACATESDVTASRETAPPQLAPFLQPVDPPVARVLRERSQPAKVLVTIVDGDTRAFGAVSGKLRWSQGTGGYVYGSPAVWRKTVYVGSYSGRFSALDAATGDVRWRFRANGDISGSATVLNGVVYFSTFKERTYALAARTGKQLWTFEDGKYGGVVADRDRLYLVGHARVYGMVEK